MDDHLAVLELIDPSVHLEASLLHSRRHEWEPPRVLDLEVSMDPNRYEVSEPELVRGLRLF